MSGEEKQTGRKCCSRRKEIGKERQKSPLRWRRCVQQRENQWTVLPQLLNFNYDHSIRVGNWQRVCFCRKCQSVCLLLVGRSYENSLSLCALLQRKRKYSSALNCSRWKRTEAMAKKTDEAKMSGNQKKIACKRSTIKCRTAKVK